MQNETTSSEQEKMKDELKTTLAGGIASIGQVCKLPQYSWTFLLNMDADQ